MPSAQPRVDLEDAAFQRAAPGPWREFANACSGVAFGALREQHFHGPAPPVDDAQAESKEVASLRAGDRRLAGVDLQAQAPLDEPRQAGHDPLSSAFASHVDVAVVGVAD